MDETTGQPTPAMQRWLDNDVKAAHRQWRKYLDGLAAYERDVLTAPEAWAPVILDNLRARTERQRRQIIDAWGVDPAREDQQAGDLKRPTNVAELFAFLEAFWKYGIDRSTLEGVETNAARLPDEHRAREACESYLAHCYAVPMMGAVLTESLAEILGTRSAQQARSEALAVSLAGYFACRISLGQARRLKWLLSLEGGSPFQNLLRHLPIEALGVWADADPLRQRMDDLFKQAKKAVEQHLIAERVTSGGADRSDRGAADLKAHKAGERGRLRPGRQPPPSPDDDISAFEARETARAEADRYTAAKERAGLAPQEREVGDLREAGLSYKEIAAQVGIAQGTVGSVLSRYREKVLRQLT